jgi:hypothetical protein
MKTRISPHPRQAGYALMIVLIMSLIAVIILGATMKRTATTAMLNERENQFNASFYAAEAAVEKVVGIMLADYQQGQDALISQHLSSYHSISPTDDNAYWGNFEFSDAQGNLNNTYVQLRVNGSTNFVPLQSQYYGLSGWRTIYRVLSNARQLNTRFNITNAVQQDMELDSIPVFQFAIFYNKDLEFTWAAPFIINGRVHANGSIYTGVSSSSSLTFNSLITTAITKSKKSLGGYLVSNMTGPEAYNGGYTTNVPTMSLPIGTNNASDAAIRAILNVPPDDEDVNSPMGLQRYYNKAGMVLLVSNTIVTAIIKSSANDSSPTTITATYSTATTNYSNVTSNFPFLSLTNTTGSPLQFTDQRENNKIVKVTQIDMYKLKTWAANNSAITSKRPSDNPFGVLFVADQRTVTSSQLDAVRLVNGTNLPSYGTGSGIGFTVATPNPLYILGNYNVPVAADAGTTNTSHTVPASVVSDALTILSASWSDAKSSGSYGSRNNPQNTTINAAILTGVVYTTGTDSTTFSGGVHNLPRLLENWTGYTLTLNTSIVNLYNSVSATNQFQLPGIYYNAPNRQFSFDVNFTNPAKQPPGTPMLGVMQRNQWASPPPNNTTYAGP